MDISMTRVESPLPAIDFDGIWNDALERYRNETVITLPEEYEDCTAPVPTLDLIQKLHPEFPLQFKIQRENNRTFRELLTEFLELLHSYATRIWPDEGESPKAIKQFYAALVFFCEVPKEKCIIVGDYLYALWKLMMRTKPYVQGEVEIETQEELARTLGEVLVTIGFASPRIKVGTLNQNHFLIVLNDNDFYMVLEHLDSLILRDDKIKSTGLLITCRESLISIRDTIQNPREEPEIRKVFLEPITREHRYLRDIGGNLKSGLLYNAARRVSWDDRNHGNIFAWLGAPDPLASHHLFGSNHGPGTGEWFLKTDEYTKWKTDPNSVMALSGKYGCGKTYLSYLVIEDLKKQCGDGSTVVAYFYFDFYEISKVTYKHLLTGLLAQLSSEYKEKCSPVLQKLYETFDNGKEPAFIQDIVATLKDMLKPFKNIYLVIDGMDEVPEFGEVAGFLRNLVQWGWDGLHVFLTCNKDVKEYPDLASLVAHQYSVKEEDTRQDILLYAEHRYKTEPALGKWKEKGLPFLHQYLPKRYEGSFQWVSCQLRSVQKARSSINAMRLLLNEMPQPMDDAYHYIFSNAHPTFHPGLEEDGLRLLPWMGFCARFLDLREYATGVEFSVDQDPPIIDGDYRLGDVEDVLELFPNVLVLDPTTHLYRVSHGSVRQYLLNNTVKFSEKTTAVFDADTSHCFIAKGCLAYLLQFNEDGMLKTGTIDKYPLAIYSAQYWFYHVAQGKTAEDPLVHQQLKQLFTPDSPQLRNWVRMYDIDKGPQQIPPQRPHDFNPNALYYASQLGLKDVVKELLEAEANKVDVNVSAGFYGNALQVAVVHKHLPVAELLVEHGADVNAQGGFYHTALQAASFSGSREIVQLLLDKGADPNAQGGYYGNALKAALKRHNSVIAGILKEENV